MSLASLARPKGTTGGGLAALAGMGRPKVSDLSTVEGLAARATQEGLGAEVAQIAGTQPKLSFLQRLTKGLGAFNPAEAILTGQEDGLASGLLEYPTRIVQGLGSALTGNDYGGTQRSFSDVAEKAGIENNIARFGIGFIGDVLLDPTTYFGGAIAKGLGFAAKGVAGTALRGVGKVAPEVEAGLKMAGTGLQDALGRAFQYGYKASAGATDDVLTFLSVQQRDKLELAASNLDRLGPGVLSKSQREELALKMIAGKRAEFAVRNSEGDLLDIAQGLPKTDDDLVFAIDDVLDHLSSTKTGADPIEASDFLTSMKGKLADGQKLTSGEREMTLDLIRQGKAESSTKITRAAAARQAARSSDPVVQKKIEEQIARSKDFAKIAGIETPYESYFPFLKTDKVQKFLKETEGIRVGSEGYRKQFKNLLTNDNIELDPAKAFFTREAQIVSDRNTREFLTGFVGKYGKPLAEFRNSDEAARLGYQIIKEKGIFGKELGYVGDFDAKLLRDSISPEFQTVNMLAKATGFDAVTSLFKRAVTGLFAPFHIRNFVSGQIQNFEVLGVAALNPKNIAIGQKIAMHMGKSTPLPNGVVQLGGKTMRFKEVMKPFMDRFSGDTFYNADFDMALKSGAELKSVAGTFSKERLKETVKTAGLGTEAIPFKVGRAVGQYIEHQQKATAYVTALGQGKSIPEALGLAEKAGFDYRALTKFESQIMRRLIPFYSFTRKNLELQLRTLGENPQRINQVMRFFSNVAAAGGLTDEERAALPDYLQEQLIMSFGKNKKGEPIVAGGFGTPIEQPGQVFGKGFSDSIRKIASSLNPIVKTPLEKAFGKDFFQDRPISEIVDAKQYQILPGFAKEFLALQPVQKATFTKDRNGKLVKTGEKTTYTADPEKLHILRNLPTTRLFGYLYEIYRPEDETIPQAKALNLLTGVKPKPIDLETVEYFRERDKKRELEDLLIRVGVLREFTKTYEPSN